MIEYSALLQENALSHLKCGAEKAKILSLLLSYGTDYSFLDFWVQRNEGAVTAVMMRFDGVVTLLALDTADFDEIALFLPAVTDTVFCDTKTAERLPLVITVPVFELEFSGKVGTNASPLSTDFNRIYDILSSSDDKDISVNSKEDFYADLSHRTRHGTAKSVLTDSSTAICPFVTDSLALIGGVAVKVHARGKGLGKKAVLDLVSNLADRKIFVIATANKVGFYEKCGFSVSNSLAYCKIK